MSDLLVLLIVTICASIVNDKTPPLRFSLLFQFHFYCISFDGIPLDLKLNINKQDQNCWCYHWQLFEFGANFEMDPSDLNLTSVSKVTGLLSYSWDSYDEIVDNSKDSQRMLKESSDSPSWIRQSTFRIET